MHGRWVRLEPLSTAHAASLFKNTADDDELWRWVVTHFPIPKNETEMVRMISQMVAQRDAGIREPFAVIDLRSNEAVGSSSFLDISPDSGYLEIGSTFYGAVARRTGINTETKLLLLTKAFETRGYERVQLKADNLNIRSRAAIERIGAKYEGTLRSHMVRRDGTRRDTVVYSILKAEWPEVKARLQLLLER
ncbi:MAG: GNAT family protein [Actinomycetes bacterium]|jgi:RimJ/RimL family protein N-acetyltransferase